MPGSLLFSCHPFQAQRLSLLCFSSYCKRAGSALATSGTAVGAAINSEIAASVSLFLWLVIDWVHHGRPGLVGLCVGSIAGLATVTPAAGYIQPWGAFILGCVAATVCYACCELRKKLKFDDALALWQQCSIVAPFSPDRTVKKHCSGSRRAIADY